MISNNIKIYASIIGLLIYSGIIWSFATTYQKNKDDIKAKTILINQQSSKISELEAERIYSNNLTFELESQNNTYVAIIESKNKDINNALQYIKSHKNYIDRTNYITDDFVRLIAGSYPYKINMPFDTSSGFNNESANRVSATDTATYCTQWRGLAEKYITYFQGCRNQYNTVMIRNNNFVLEKNK